jgi:hypothetical protein
MRDHLIRVKSQLKKEGEKIKRENQRGLDQFVKNQDNNAEKE